MDELIEKKTWSFKRLLTIGLIGLVAVAIIYTLFSGPNTSSLTVATERISIDQVRVGEFAEYVPVVGRVRPKVTVYLDLEEGGIVEEIFIESGNRVDKGDLILGFSNSAVQKNNIDSETRLLENLNQLRNSKISLTEQNLILKEQLLDLNFSILELERTFARYKRLHNEQNTILSLEQFESARDRLSYLIDKKKLLEERIAQESILRERQSTQVDDSIERVNRSLSILTQIMGSLVLRAPISGYLSSMSAEVGQNFSRGQRVGQIDQLDQFKVTVSIDQYYISRVAVEQVGEFDFGGQSYQLRINKIHPEVAEDATFQVDMEFVSTVPGGIKRGQSLQIDLNLSASRTANLVTKGGFYRHTNGRWVYQISDDGARAYRVDLVPGRQNPESFEVLEGLVPGDWIISSSYDGFRDVDELILEPPTQLTKSL